MHRLLIITALLMTITSAHAASALPYTFQAGQPARAAEMNENLAFIHDKARSSIGALIALQFIAQSELDTPIAVASCPADTLLVSANCSCNSANGTRNFGVLMACDVAGNNGVVACFPEVVSFDPSLPPPRGDITVSCLTGLDNDGNPLPGSLLPVGVAVQGASLTAGADTSSAAKSIGAALSQPRPTGSQGEIATKAGNDELNEKLNALRQQVADHDNLIRNR